mmetsp:Transcript_53842/g.116387  ORF Transcript_53842/g.116387 Transcript_53842/m.116387 type:complete len:130 (+) Transcript_53842:305-694(+)
MLTVSEDGTTASEAGTAVSEEGAMVSEVHTVASEVGTKTRWKDDDSPLPPWQCCPDSYHRPELCQPLPALAAVTPALTPPHRLAQHPAAGAREGAPGQSSMPGAAQPCGLAARAVPPLWVPLQSRPCSQ